MSAPSQTIVSLWADAVERYVVARAATDAIPIGTDGEDAFAAVECDALDALIERTPAPDLPAVAYKIALAQERADASEDMFYDVQLRSIIADVKRLASMAVHSQPIGAAA